MLGSIISAFEYCHGNNIRFQHNYRSDIAGEPTIFCGDGCRKQQSVWQWNGDEFVLCYILYNTPSLLLQVITTTLYFTDRWAEDDVIISESMMTTWPIKTSTKIILGWRCVRRVVRGRKVRWRTGGGRGSVGADSGEMEPNRRTLIGSLEGEKILLQ